MPRLLVFAITFLASLGSLAAEDPPATLIDQSQQLLRVLRYEAELGSELSPRTALCVDEGMAKHGLILLSRDEVFSRRAQAQLRKSADACALAEQQHARASQPDADATTRAVGELRTSLAGLFEFSEKLRKVKPCLDGTRSVDALESCVVAVTGVKPSPEEWQRWIVLNQRSQP
jgi:hypothetical protein